MKPAYLFILANIIVTVAPLARGQLLNGDFSDSTNHWSIVLPASNTQPAANGIASIDIDGPGPLASSPAFYANVGNDALLHLEQDVALSAAVSYQFAADLAMTPAGNNADGGTITVFINSTMIASNSFGSTTAGVNKYVHLTGTYSPPDSGLYTLSIHFSRNFGPGGIFSTPTDYIDNVALSPTLVPLNFQLNGGEIILTWTNPAFALQGAPLVTGNYTNIAGATSPFTNMINGSQGYFRLMAN